jgi:hypothetical protein
MNSSVGLQQYNSLFSFANDLPGIRRLLLRFAFANLLLVACLGVLLRSFPYLSYFPLSYKNILHGHSHLAFGGWVMPVLLFLVLHYFSELAQKVAVRHWRNISFLLIVSAVGMFVAFPLQGYKAVSIFFSTLSIVAGFYMAFVIRKALPKNTSTASSLFLRAGLFYLVLSAIGPLATGPLIAFGKAGSPLYYNAIYFYLHFQYNGWFSFAVLAVLYKMLEQKGARKNGLVVFWLLNIACVPAYLLSVLWMQPPIMLNMLGGLAALLQLHAVYLFLKDVRDLSWKSGWANKIIWLSMGAFVVKNVLQLASAFPSVAALAYEHRNFVIAYLHLVLLGFVSLFAFGAILKACSALCSKGFKSGFLLFFVSFIITELLLVGQATGAVFNFPIPYYSFWLLLFSCFLLAGVAVIGRSIQKALS